MRCDSASTIAIIAANAPGPWGNKLFSEIKYFGFTFCPLRYITYDIKDFEYFILEFSRSTLFEHDRSSIAEKEQINLYCLI